MKTFKLFTLTVLLVVLSSPFAFTQTFDANRMNRDINIMENILNEMFRIQNVVTQSSSGNVAVVSSSYNFSFGGNSVRGTYMPGYGVIFMVNNKMQFPRAVNLNSNQGYSFYYSTSDNSDRAGDDMKVDEESVINRIQEFLKDYASTIGQLKPDENVIVIFGNNQNDSFRALTFALHTERSSRDETVEEEALPVISVSARKSDLDAYRAGRLSEEAFEDRLNVATSEDREYLDLKVMSNIFQTALKPDGKPSFGVYGNISYLMLDNFGAIFNMDASYRGGSNAFFRVNGITASGAYITSQSQSRDDVKKEEEEYLQKVTDSFEQLKQNFREYLVDYGRTLSSVRSDQYILATVDINGRFEGIPDRIDVQVQKSVLEQLDRGAITREAALEQVVITEY